MQYWTSQPIKYVTTNIPWSKFIAEKLPSNFKYYSTELLSIVRMNQIFGDGVQVVRLLDKSHSIHFNRTYLKWSSSELIKKIILNRERKFS